MVCSIVLDTCESIVEHLFHKYVKLPQGKAVKEAMDGFDLIGWDFLK